MTGEILLGLIEPGLSLFYNRRSKRKERLELFYLPMFDDITGLHNDWTELLQCALYQVEELERRTLKVQRKRNGPVKKVQSDACRVRLELILKEVNKDLVTRDTLCIKIDSYRNLKRRRFLKTDEQCFLKAVLAYLPMVNEDLFNDISISGNSLPEYAARLLERLRWSIDHQEILYREICTTYGNLQLSVLG
jgi:uncharacterized protein YlaI